MSETSLSTKKSEETKPKVSKPKVVVHKVLRKVKRVKEDNLKDLATNTFKTILDLMINRDLKDGRELNTSFLSNDKKTKKFVMNSLFNPFMCYIKSTLKSSDLKLYTILSNNLNQLKFKTTNSLVDIGYY